MFRTKHKRIEYDQDYLVSILKEILEKRDLTIQELQKELNCGNLYKILNKERKPEIINAFWIIKIAERSDRSIKEILCNLYKNSTRTNLLCSIEQQLKALKDN